MKKKYQVFFMHITEYFCNAVKTCGPVHRYSGRTCMVVHNAYCWILAYAQKFSLFTRILRPKSKRVGTHRPQWLLHTFVYSSKKEDGASTNSGLLFFILALKPW